MVEITSFVAEQNYPILYVCFVGFVLDIFLTIYFYVSTFNTTFLILSAWRTEVSTIKISKHLNIEQVSQDNFKQNSSILFDKYHGISKIYSEIQTS